MERIAMFIAYRLPRRVVYWAVIRCWSHGTTGQYSDTEASGMTIETALSRWQHRQGTTYFRGWFTPARVTLIGDAGIILCAAAVLYMAATQFAVGCGVLP